MIIDESISFSIFTLTINHCTLPFALLCRSSKFFQDLSFVSIQNCLFWICLFFGTFISTFNSLFLSRTLHLCPQPLPWVYWHLRGCLPIRLLCKYFYEINRKSHVKDHLVISSDILSLASILLSNSSSIVTTS